ncbi:MAG: hypothetical protein EKK48_14050 [Candidatus Melainabacteria bacterium]|nr:MAG: hypothetical protein EKK48_14050 [Candidatus Melainabacteria bacterium]
MKLSRCTVIFVFSGILASTFLVFSSSSAVAQQDSSSTTTTLVQEGVEQNQPIPSLEQTYTYDRVQSGGTGVDPTANADDPYDTNPDFVDEYDSRFDDKDFNVSQFLQDPGMYFSRWVKLLLRDVVRPLARKLSALLLLFVLNPNIAADGLRDAKTDVQKLFNQTADVMFYIAIDLSLLFFVLAIWRHWSDGAWRGRSGGWMSAIGRLIFTIAVILLWKTMYTLELDLTNEMIKAVWFNDPAQRNLLVDTIEKVFVAIMSGTAGLALASFAPFMGALGGSIVGGPAGMVIGGAGGSIAALVGWLLFIVFGVVIITEIVYFLVLKAIQEALLAAQFLFGYIFLVCFASPDTEHMATGFVRSFIEVSLWSFVWLVLLKVLCIVLNASDQASGAQILLIIGVLQIMIQVPSFMGRAQISPVSEFLTAGAATGLVSKGLTGVTESIKKAATDISDYQLNAKYASVGTPETTATTLKLPSTARAPEAYAQQLEAPRQKAGRLENGDTNINSTYSSAASASGAGGNAVRNSSTVNTSQSVNRPVPPSKAPEKKLEGLTGHEKTETQLPSVAPEAIDKPLDQGSGQTSTQALEQTLEQTSTQSLDQTSGQTPMPFADLDTNDSESSRATSTPAEVESSADTENLRRVHPAATKGLARVLAHFYTNARMRPWVQDLNDGTNMANYGTGSESTIHMGERGARMVQYAQGASEEEMGFTIATAAMATDLANNPRGRDAARRSVLARHLDQPRTLGEHAAAAALYTAKGQFFNQSKLGQSRGHLGMLDELAAGSAHYLTLGDAGHENDVSKQLTDTFNPYDNNRQAGMLAQMTDEDSTESGLNRSNASATRTNISHGFQINDLMRAIYASNLVAGTRIGQRDKAIGMYNYIEAMVNKSGSQMGNHEAQPLVNAITPEEADACRVISKFEGPEACRNPALVRAVADMAGAGSSRTSHETAFAALRTHVRQNSGEVSSLADASPTVINLAAQTVQQLRRAGFDDSQIANPEVAEVVAGFQANAVGHPSPQVVQAVLGGASASSENLITPSHLADQVLRNIGAPSNSQNRQLVVQMINDGYEAKGISYDDFKVAGALMDHGGGNVSPQMIQMAQANGYTHGRKLSRHTVAQGIATRLSAPGDTIAEEQIEAAHLLLNNHIPPETIDGNMLKAAVLLRANGASSGVLNAANMEIAQRLVAHNAPPTAFNVDNLNAAKWVSPSNQNVESINAARYMLDAQFVSDEHPIITDQALFIGKGLVENKINPTPEIVAAVMKNSEYQAHPYQYGVTPPTERAHIPQQIIAQYAATNQLPVPPAPQSPPFNSLSGN